VLRIMLVRHAEPVLPAPGLGEYDRPLTAAGRQAAAALAPTFPAVDAIYASPYPRALETVAPLADQRGLRVEIIDDLRERLLSPVALADWRAELARTWADFDHAPAGGETSRTAQRRVIAVLETLRARHATGTLALGSHGNLIALALHALDPRIDFAFWSAMPMPAVYTIEHDGSAWSRA
jgi:2,3-bisphosphoglycerate-dependent phosphoglycerate mutase